MYTKIAKLLVLLTIVTLLFLIPEQVLAQDYCPTASITSNATDPSLFIDGNFDRIDYSINLEPGEEDKAYLVYTDDLNGSPYAGNHRQNFDPPHASRLDGLIDKSTILNNINFPFQVGTHTIYVVRSPGGVGEQICNSFEYTVLEALPEPPPIQYDCQVDITPKYPTDKDVVIIDGSITPQLDQLQWATLYINGQKLKQISRSESSSFTYNAGALIPKDYNVRIDILYADVRRGPVVLATCNRGFTVCTPEEIEQTPEKCGLNPTPLPGVTITPTPVLKEICESVADNPETEDRNELDDCNACMGQGGGYIYTAIGCLPTDPAEFLEKYVFTVGLGMAGGIAFFLILWGGFSIIMSQGDPQRITHGKEIIVSAIAGLLLIIFAVFVLHQIGAVAIRIPGFGPTPAQTREGAPPPDILTSQCYVEGGTCTAYDRCIGPDKRIDGPSAKGCDQVNSVYVCCKPLSTPTPICTGTGPCLSR